MDVVFTHRSTKGGSLAGIVLDSSTGGERGGEVSMAECMTQIKVAIEPLFGFVLSCIIELEGRDSSGARR